jgi:hypothetical protein
VEFVPIFQELATEFEGEINISDLATFGAVWRLCGLDKQKCTASPETISQRIGVSVKTVRRSLKYLVGAGLIEDLTPNRRGYCKEYIITEFAYKILDCNGQHDQSNQEDIPNEMDNLSTAQGTECPEQNYCNGQNDQSANSAMDKMTNKDISSCSSSNGTHKKPADFGVIYSRLAETFGNDCLVAREIEILGDYYDENPLFTERAVDQTIIYKPEKGIFPYFKRIIDGWLKLGEIPEREPAKMPAKGGPYVRGSPDIPAKELTPEQVAAYERLKADDSS